MDKLGHPTCDMCQKWRRYKYNPRWGVCKKITPYIPTDDEEDEDVAAYIDSYDEHAELATEGSAFYCSEWEE